MIQKLRTRAENESGFTLIELLIVIIILGILATIVLFATGTFTSDSKTAACKANAKILNIAEAAYSAANNGSASNHSYTGAGNQLGTYLQDTIDSSNAPTYASGTGWKC